MALGTIGEDPLVKDRARSIHVERTPVAPDLLAPIVSVVAWNGGPAEYEDFWTRIRQAPTPQEEVRYLFRLSAFPDPELLERTLDATLDEIRAQNGAFVVATALANRAAGREAWEWVTQHWDDILKRLPDNSHGRMLEGIVRLTDPSAVAAVADFLADHPIPSARKQVDQLLERQQVNAAFAARARDEVARWFNSAGT
jgi:puromycin-sensitive aminopeptidase